jgi:hypothetical protein
MNGPARSRGSNAGTPTGDREARDAAFAFLSKQLPGLVPRGSPAASATGRPRADAGVSPRPPHQPTAFLSRASPQLPRRAIQHRALSQLRRKRAEPMATVPEPPQEHSAPPQERQVAARQALAALRALSAEDRIALKLTATPEALDEDELDWLAARNRTSREAVRVLALRAESTEARAQLFDGAVQPPREADAGRTIDRFHKRVSRARQRLLSRIGGDP